MMLFFLLFFIISEVTTELILKDLYVRGEGVATQAIIRGDRDYKSIQNVIFEEGPSIIDSAFNEMRALKTISFSKTIKLFRGNSFFRNYELRKFIVSIDNPYIWTDGTFLYQNNNNTLIGAIHNPTHFNILPTVSELFQSGLSSVVYSGDIILPKSISIISSGSFSECSLGSLRFESGCELEIIPEYAATWCTIKTFAIPSSVKQIHYQAFSHLNSPGLYFENVANSNLTYIASSAFSYCVCTNITLPSGVTEIPSYCFQSSSLTSIRISEKCSNISETAFSGCSELSSVTVEPGNVHYKDVKGSLYSVDGKMLVFAPPLLESFEITPEVEIIAQSVVQSLVKIDKITLNGTSNFFSVFEGCLHSKNGEVLRGVCGGVKYLNVSARTTSIMNQACKGVGVICVKFLGTNCISLGDEVFCGCKNLTEFCVPKGLKTIGKSCFVESGLTSFTYESVSSLIQVNERAFQGLSLRTIKIPKSLTNAEYCSFNSLSNVEVFELEVGSLLESIGELSFANMKCTKPNSIILPSTLKRMYNNAFKFSGLEVRFERECQIKSLNEEVFRNCESIKGIFLIPAKIETICMSALAGCVNIEKIVFEKGSELKSVMGSAFAGCTKLLSFELPNLTESFDNSAIRQCFNLLEFTVSKENTNFVADGCILYNYQKTELIVCSPAVIDTSVDKNVESIRSNGFYECEKLRTVLFLSPSNLQTISQNTFAGCTNLTEILLPTKLREVSDGAFKGCKMLSRVKFGIGGVSNLIMIGSNVFKDCLELKQVEFNGNALTSIGISAFEGCYKLKEIEIPKSLKRAGKWCFKSSAIRKAELGLIEELGEGCFQNCTSLVNVTIESELITEFPKSLFEGCSNLEHVTIPMNVEVLRSRCLSGIGITNITVPFSVINIDSECFMNDANLKAINISCQNVTISNSCFLGCNNLESIIYCSTKVIKGNYGLSSKCVAYVNSNYAGKELLGLAVRRQLREGCLFVDPTATPTLLFTGLVGGKPNSLMMITATVAETQE